MSGTKSLKGSFAPSTSSKERKNEEDPSDQTSSDECLQDEYLDKGIAIQVQDGDIIEEPGMQLEDEEASSFFRDSININTKNKKGNKQVFKLLGPTNSILEQMGQETVD